MRAVAAVAVALLISTTSHSAVAQYDQANKGYQHNHNLQPGTPGVRCHADADVRTAAGKPVQYSGRLLDGYGNYYFFFFFL
jgi:hypothetical protein